MTTATATPVPIRPTLAAGVAPRRPQTPLDARLAGDLGRRGHAGALPVSRILCGPLTPRAGAPPGSAFVESFVPAAPSHPGEAVEALLWAFVGDDDPFSGRRVGGVA